MQSSYHKYENGKEIHYTKKQNKLAQSKSGYQKIKGVAGSGKTLILARRAVNAYKRTSGKILILTFNITFKNYIHDRISEVRENFSWANFEINNYHCFISSKLNNLGVAINSCGFTDPEEVKRVEEEYFSNEKLFENLKDKILKYDAIFIDEVQDYKKQWLNIIKNYFLKSNGEYVLFGDEKQNVYNRELEKDRRPKTNVIGNWNVLNESFRLSSDIANIAMRFQKQYFTNKYDIDMIKIVKIQKTIWDINHYIDYMYLNAENCKFICNKIFHILKNLNIHSNDVCIVGTKIDTLRNLDYIIRNDLKQKTSVVFEKEEDYKLLKYNNRLNELHNIRRNRKFNFTMNAGTLKICTVHSFKGWEVSTLILLIDKEDDISEELIYTGLTRAINNLIVINLGNDKYHEFFKKI